LGRASALPYKEVLHMSKFSKNTIKYVLIIIGFFLLLSVTIRACDTSIKVSENAVIIPGECIVINYDATEAEFDAAKAAWLEALKDNPAKDTGHTKAYY
jgi:hypothetical protein